MKDFGLVLGGGGAKGAYQIGVMKALEEFGINITAYSGSSIGSLNEALMISNNYSKCSEIWENLKFEDIFDLDDDDDLVNGISNREGLIKLIKENINFEIIQNDQIPLFVTICTDENTRTGQYILLNNKSKKEIIDLLLASSALPIIYNKVNINNHQCLDGGLFDNNPIDPLYDNGFESLIIVPCSHNYQFNKYMYPSKDIILIKPSMDLKGLIEGTLNFNKAEIMLRLDLGYSDAKRALNNYYGIPNEHTVEYDNELILQRYNINKWESKINSRFDYIKKYDI